MFKARCHCGNVTISANEIPQSLTRCNCSICNRLGALWAYYKTKDVEIKIGIPTSVYLWDKKEIEFHHCSNCGNTTHYTALDSDGEETIAINARMAEPKDIENIPIKTFDGAVTWKYLNE